jgi:hypothetical protein
LAAVIIWAVILENEGGGGGLSRLFNRAIDGVATVATDPKAELQGIVSDFQSHNSGASGFSFDVRKTDSLVSPYMGTVGYRRTEFDWAYQVTFAYQENKWVVTEAVRRLKGDYSCEKDNSERDVWGVSVKWFYQNRAEGR